MNISCFPGKKNAKEKKNPFVGDYSQHPGVEMLRVTLMGEDVDLYVFIVWKKLKVKRSNGKCYISLEKHDLVISHFTNTYTVVLITSSEVIGENNLTKMIRPNSMSLCRCQKKINKQKLLVFQINMSVLLFSFIRFSFN